LTSPARRIQADLIAAMKGRDTHRVETLRGLTSDLKYRKIQLGAELSEEDVEAVLRQAAKRRREAADAFRKGDRPDLAAREAAELEWILAYLPPELTDTELDDKIRAAIADVGATGAQHLGKVMSAVMAGVKGQADGSRVRARVQALLQS